MSEEGYEKYEKILNELDSKLKTMKDIEGWLRDVSKILSEYYKVPTPYVYVRLVEKASGIYDYKSFPVKGAIYIDTDNVRVCMDDVPDEKIGNILSTFYHEFKHHLQYMDASRLFPNASPYQRWELAFNAERMKIPWSRRKHEIAAQEYAFKMVDGFWIWLWTKYEIDYLAGERPEIIKFQKE